MCDKNPYCTAIDIVYKRVGPHIGAYCAHCGEWHGWVKQTSEIIAKVPIETEDDQS